MNVLTGQPTTDGKRLRGKLLSERATNLRNGQQMNYGTGDSLTSRSLALCAEFLEDLAVPGLSKKQTESKPVRDTSKITGERSRSGVPSFGIHNEYFTIKDYFKSDDDRHYQKDSATNGLRMAKRFRSTTSVLLVNSFASITTKITDPMCSNLKPIAQPAKKPRTR